MKRLSAAALAAAFVIPLPVQAADTFSLSYNVERVGAQKMNVNQCLDAAKAASDAIGYRGAVSDRHGDKLTVYASAPAGGGASLVVYCIAVDTKTTFVVQAIDFQNNAARAKQASDAVFGALMSKAR